MRPYAPHNLLISNERPTLITKFIHKNIILNRRKTVLIPFNKPYSWREEEINALQAIHSGKVCGNNLFCQKCIEWMRETYGFNHVFLTPSCTAAMEMGAMLADLGPGDEVILPSYTFSSTVTAIVSQGATPVFCEIRGDTLNIDETKIESLITSKTKLILPIDYAGIPCEIDEIIMIAKRHNLLVMEDAAQSFHSYYKEKPIGSHMPLVAFSFHETKNNSCGEGGALIVKDENMAERACFLQEKGTDRTLVLRGNKTKYWWVDKGSSFLLSDILAAVLLPQLKNAEFISSERSKITDAYRKLYQPYVETGLLTIPVVPEYVRHNHHAFFVIFDTEENRFRFLEKLKQRDIHAYIGYLPLHSSPMGRKFGYKPNDLPFTESVSKRVVRLPFYTALAANGLDTCIAGMKAVLKEIYGF